MIYMIFVLKRRGSREKGTGGNEIHAQCACVLTPPLFFLLKLLY